MFPPLSTADGTNGGTGCCPAVQHRRFPDEGTPRAQRIVKLNAAIIALAKSRDLPVFLYSRNIVRETFFQ